MAYCNDKQRLGCNCNLSECLCNRTAFLNRVEFSDEQQKAKWVSLFEKEGVKQCPIWRTGYFNKSFQAETLLDLPSTFKDLTPEWKSIDRRIFVCDNTDKALLTEWLYYQTFSARRKNDSEVELKRSPVGKVVRYTFDDMCSIVSNKGQIQDEMSNQPKLKTADVYFLDASSCPNAKLSSFVDEFIGYLNTLQGTRPFIGILRNANVFTEPLNGYKQFIVSRSFCSTNSPSQDYKVNVKVSSPGKGKEFD